GGDETPARGRAVRIPVGLLDLDQPVPGVVGVLVDAVPDEVPGRVVGGEVAVDRMGVAAGVECEVVLVGDGFEAAVFVEVELQGEVVDLDGECMKPIMPPALSKLDDSKPYGWHRSSLRVRRRFPGTRR